MMDGLERNDVRTVSSKLAAGYEDSEGTMGLEDN
jgi:hypothetical protein